jgi:hypothetical protein
MFAITQNKIHLLRWIYWVYDQCPILHTSGFTATWGRTLIDLMAGLKRQPVCILIKTDEARPSFCTLITEND